MYYIDKHLLGNLLETSLVQLLASGWLPCALRVSTSCELGGFSNLE